MRNADLDRRVSIEKHNAIDENKLPVKTKTRFSGCFYFIFLYKPLTKYSILQVLYTTDILYYYTIFLI